MPEPEFLTLFWRVLVAMGVGLLFGLERGWHQRGLAEGQRAAGIRTFTLVGMAGGLAAALEAHAGLTLLAIALVLLSVLVLFLVYENWRAGFRGVTDAAENFYWVECSDAGLDNDQCDQCGDPAGRAGNLRRIR